MLILRSISSFAAQLTLVGINCVSLVQIRRMLSAVKLTPLQAESEQFNKTWSQRDTNDPILEFSVAAAQAAYTVCNKYFLSLLEQARMISLNHVT